MDVRTRIKSAALALCLFGLIAAVPETSFAAGGTIVSKVTATPTKYLTDTVVYIKEVKGKYKPKTAQMDQKGMKFIPHVLAITVGDTVEFLNHDHVMHNVFSPEGGYNLGTWGYGEKRSHKFDKAGVYSQLCSLHPEMLGYVFVGQNPYSAVVGANGVVTIRNVPPGSYELDVWNSKLKAAGQRVNVVAGKTLHVSFAIRR